ncbi:UDP-2,4-diacetamido-2,4,6-trideoxy-beta-L-altropy ranose hydrolase [Ferrigenium kumadai]|uniref:UDP-2,4-diacetamido-2,4, 6-trideoxy-beta-L-altropy ranose hydrolase n=2 Tax=Ferrigenium kumadai TaxID=1682490 RepID=A0AAN1W0R7_9PROT|nr:UDP-2,4-diacetamido-2,4,6-trideoxy-beta-L-altropy ranose hydrolase [Ferrigenium kumadai]
MRDVVFRADASLNIGTGHVMRCLTLADALQQRGARCRFVCRAHPGNLTDLIRQRGFKVHVLPELEYAHYNSSSARECTHAAWLGSDWPTDAAQTKIGIGETVADWLVVDHYAIDANWERQLRPACRHLMVIDDLADRLHDCDLLLDQNSGRVAADYFDLVPAGCTVLVGPKYALIRPEFAALRNYSLARRASPQLKHLLITMGGVDKDNATTRVLDALKDSSLPADCRITVVMGPHAPWLTKVREKAKETPWATEVLVNVQDMAKLMADSDLAIGAAGTSAWERCCLGLPTLTMVLADNQREGAAALKEMGAVLLLESGDQLAVELHEKISLLLGAQRLLAMQQACIAVTDGAGVSRLAAMITNAND